MADRYVVSGAAVVLPTDGGSERYLYRGASVGEGFTDAGIKHALAMKLIVKVKAPTAAEKKATEAAVDPTAAEKAAAELAAAEAK